MVYGIILDEYSARFILATYVRIHFGLGSGSRPEWFTSQMPVPSPFPSQ